MPWAVLLLDHGSNFTKPVSMVMVYIVIKSQIHICIANCHSIVATLHSISHVST